MTEGSIYVSITGLQLRGPWHAPRFWWHAVRSMMQARSAPGNVIAEARIIAGVHHTLSAWTDEAAMRAYLSSGAHRKAMRVFRAIATGRTLGFTAERVPDWSSARALWEADGRVV